MVIGPDIDPPAMQGRTRPCGVYRRPDPRAGCEGRVLMEIWDDAGICLYFGSVYAGIADSRTEVAAWSVLEDWLMDRRAVVGGPSPSWTPTPSRLAIVR